MIKPKFQDRRGDYFLVLMAENDYIGVERVGHILKSVDFRATTARTAEPVGSVNREHRGVVFVARKDKSYPTIITDIPVQDIEFFRDVIPDVSVIAQADCLLVVAGQESDTFIRDGLEQVCYVVYLLRDEAGKAFDIIIRVDTLRVEAFIVYVDTFTIIAKARPKSHRIIFYLLNVFFQFFNIAPCAAEVNIPERFQAIYLCLA